MMSFKNLYQLSVQQKKAKNTNSFNVMNCMNMQICQLKASELEFLYHKKLYMNNNICFPAADNTYMHN